MYKIKQNKETKKLEIVITDNNVHSSVISKGEYDKIFNREYARFEYFKLYVRYLNDGIKEGENGLNKDEIEQMNLLADAFKIDTCDSHTMLDGLNDELKGLMLLQLFAHGKLIKSVTKDDDGVYKLNIPIELSLGLNEFYSVCKKTVREIEVGDVTLEQAVDVIKPFYNKSCEIINHNAVENVCKKWTESTKEKNTRAFIMGLLNHYKITRSNAIKKESPLKNQNTFEKYFAMWLVTEGKIVGKDTVVKVTQSFDTFLSKF